jgi:hypothetical protein
VIKSNVLSLALILALGGAATAQEADPFGKAMEGAPPSGVPARGLRVPEVPAAAPADAPKPSNPLDDLAREVRAKPRAAAAADAGAPGVPGGPAAVPVAPAPVPAASPAGPAGPAPEQADDSNEINANYDVTQSIYEKILEQQANETGAIDKRAASNEDILHRYRPELVKNEQDLRRLQVEFMNRAFQLRQQKDSGQISDEMFQRQIKAEQEKWERRKSAIKGDVDFYREEMGQAEVRLASLKTQKRTIEDKIARDNAGKPKPKPPAEALFDGFNATLDKLNGFQTRFTMDGNVGCKQCNTFGHDDSKHDQEKDKAAPKK